MGRDALKRIGRAQPGAHTARPRLDGGPGTRSPPLAAPTTLCSSRDTGLTGLPSSSPVCGDCGGLLVMEMAAMEIAGIVAAPCVLLLLHLSDTHLPLVIQIFDSICLLLLLSPRSSSNFCGCGGLLVTVPYVLLVCIPYLG